jgi:hypothetical protein
MDKDTRDLSEKYYERHNGMPIPPVKENMEIFRAGAISIGVEFRVLTPAVLGALGIAERIAAEGRPIPNDRGVSFHVFAKTAEGDYERLRFDCFDAEPHYHYFSMTKRVQDLIHIDPNVTGDIIGWSLNVIRMRLPQMLRRADVEDAAELVDPLAIEQVMPLVTEAAYRARYHTDSVRLQEIEKGAMAKGRHLYDTSQDRSWGNHSQG